MLFKNEPLISISSQRSLLLYILKDSLYLCFKVIFLNQCPNSTNVALSDFPINLHGVPRKYPKMGIENAFLMETDDTC